MGTSKRLMDLKRDLKLLVDEKRSMKFLAAYDRRNNLWPWEQERIKEIDKKAGKLRQAIEMEMGVIQARQVKEVIAFEKSCCSEEE